MKNKKISNMIRIIILLCILIITCYSSTAIGIAPAKEIVTYNGPVNYSFRIINNDKQTLNIKLLPSGELSEYIKLEKDTLTINPEQYEVPVEYSLNIPKEFASGMHNTKILVSTSDNGAIISSVNSIAYELGVFIPIPGKHLGTVFNINSDNNGQTVSISLTNTGTELINNIAGKIIISDSFGAEIDTIILENVTELGTNTRKNYNKYWGENVKSGNYTFKLLVQYDNQEYSDSKEIVITNPIYITGINFDDNTIGGNRTLSVSINNNVQEDIIIYGDIILTSDKGRYAIEMDKVNVNGLSEGELIGKWDTTNVEPGIYSTKITVKYIDGATERNVQTIVENGSIIIEDKWSRSISNIGQKYLYTIIYTIGILIIISTMVVGYNYFRKK
jgi:hypothetical protein